MSRVVRAHVATHADPIVVRAGERVTVGREDDEWRGRRWCRDARGHEGWLPVVLLDGEIGRRR